MLRLGGGWGCVRRVLRFVLLVLSEGETSGDGHPGNLTSESLLYEHGTCGGQICSLYKEDPVPRHRIALCGHDTTRKRRAPVCVVAPVWLTQGPFHWALSFENCLVDAIEGTCVGTDIVSHTWFLGDDGGV